LSLYLSWYSLVVESTHNPVFKGSSSSPAGAGRKSQKQDKTTIDIIVLDSLDQLLFILKYDLPFFYKTSYLN
jgi:hypothetical protein